MFLIEKLPKESEKAVNESVSEVAVLEKSIASAISQGFSIPWLPYYCHKKGFRNRGRPSIPYTSVNIEVPVANMEDGNVISISIKLFLLSNYRKKRVISLLQITKTTIHAIYNQCLIKCITFHALYLP